MRAYERMLNYVKIWTTSDSSSESVPSTSRQFDLARILVEEMKKLGIEDAHVDDKCYVYGTLPAKKGYEDKTKLGFIAHLDTSEDMSGQNVNPQIIENYDGKDINLGESGRVIKVSDFEHLKDFKGRTLITTDGSTLLGADDKSGIAEIMTAMEILINNPSIPHGTIKVAFGPDEEIGVGADKFDVEQFNVDFAYTVDGGPLGELQYETFSAAQANITIQGKNVHPGTAKDTMINALQLAIDFHNQLPADEVPEKTEGYEGFFHLMALNGNPEEASMSYIIRDHDREKFEARKAQITHIQEELNQRFDQERIKVDMYDQYYNMKEIIEKDMSIVELAKQAMIELGISPVIEPVRGGTDGSKISYMGIPTPNLFAGGENMHGRFEFVSLQVMEKATDVIVKIAELNTKS